MTWRGANCQIRSAPGMAGFENMARFRPGPGPDTKSGATLAVMHFKGDMQRFFTKLMNSSF